MVKLSEKLSSIVLTFNGEDYLEKCLKNLSRVSDELLVVDSGSSDGSLDIAKKYASKIKYHKFENYGRQCSFAVSKTMNDMVLVVDQDEILSEELIEEIKLLKKNGFQHDGYFIKRDNFLFGKHVKYSGWGNDYVLRLFNKEKGQHTDNNFAVVKVDGKTDRLSESIIHFPYSSIDEYLSKMHKYAILSAKEMKEKGRKFRIHNLIFNPFYRFFKKFVLQKGFLDGFNGYILAIFAFYFVFLKYIRLWELFKDEKNSCNRRW